MTTGTRLRAVVLGCSLKPSSQESSSEKLGREVAAVAVVGKGLPHLARLLKNAPYPSAS